MPELSGVPRVATYRHLMRIASGGMGHVDVVLRSQGSFSRIYARKSLHGGLRHDPDIRRMFVAEAQIAGAVTHPNVVRVLDVGDDQATGPFLIMDYVDGVSVAEIVQLHAKQSLQVPLSIVLAIVRDAALGLHAAHHAVSPDGGALAVVHRDVSPQNILVGFDGITRMTDFGVAKVLGHLAETQQGVVKGKLGYMSPEQVLARELDFRSDLFSLGIVLYELLSGERLYATSEGVHAGHKILNEPPPDIGDCRGDAPPALVALLFSLLAKDRAHRPESAAAVAEQLADAAQQIAPDELPLALWLDEWFGEARRARAARVAAAVREHQQAEHAHDDEAATVVDAPREEDLGTAIDVAAYRGPDPRSGVVFVVALVVALLALALVGCWALWPAS